MNSIIEDMRRKYKKERCYPLIFPDHNIRTQFEGSFTYLNEDEVNSTLSKFGYHIYLLETQLYKLENELYCLQTQIRIHRTQIQTNNIYIDSINEQIERAYVQHDPTTIHSDVEDLIFHKCKYEKRIEDKVNAINNCIDKSEDISRKISVIKLKLDAYIEDQNNRMDHQYSFFVY